MPQSILDVIATVDRSWPEDYIVRYLYVKLAPCFERDLYYFLASDEEKLAQYKAGFIDRGTKIVCSTLVDYYIRIFALFGINAKKIAATNATIPLFAMLVEGKDGWYYMDPLNDLLLNQYGLETRYFGVIPKFAHFQEDYPFIKTVPKEKIEEMNRDLGLYNDSLSFEKLQECRQFLVHSHACKIFGLDTKSTYELVRCKMRFLEKNLINLGNVPGLYERYHLYGLLKRHIFDKNERKMISPCIISTDPVEAKLYFVIDYPEIGLEVYEENIDANGLYFLQNVK